jgi:aldehyde:ferredoxin oxidoreductase
MLFYLDLISISKVNIFRLMGRESSDKYYRSTNKEKYRRNIMNGFYGRILKVDLNHKKSEIDTLDDAIYEKYLGGKGLASYLLYELNPPGVDPLAPENILIFTTGPLGGSSIWGSCRYGVFTKSPLTGFFTESYSGGKTPDAIDATGFDAVVIQGRCDEPAVLTIHPEGVDFHPAGEFWGMESYEAEDAINERFARDEYRKKGALAIGPASENLVRFGCIKNDYWRSAGRTGAGTVMGSKKIKGILFTGNRKRPHADEAAAWPNSKITQRPMHTGRWVPPCWSK